MSKKTGIIVAVIIVLILGVGAWALSRNSSNSSSSTSGYGSTSKTNTTPKTSTTSVNPASAVQTKTDSSVGSYLANSSDNALYTYGADSTGVSNCTGSCLYSWPVYAPGPTTGLPANVTVITRSDGSKQYAYKGMPLYTFTSDATGQVSGDGVSNFHVAKP